MSDIFTLEEALNVQKSLREAAGAEPEQFEVEDVVGMVSDEIEMLMEQGKSHAEIAAMMTKTSGKTITSQDVENFYVSAEERNSWDEDGGEDGGEGEFGRA